MERLFAELIAIRLLLGRVIANQAHASGDAARYLKDQLDQTMQDLEAVTIAGKDPEQEKLIRGLAEFSLKDIVTRINFPN